MKEIPLTQGKIALIDDDDFEKVKRYKWYAAKHYINADNAVFYVYARHPENSKTIRIHNIILDKTPKGFEVDHIDGDGLNNQKSNLRFVTHRQNMQNQHGKKKRSSKSPGVTKYTLKKNIKWRAKININGKQIYLGSYNTEEEAYHAYVEECKKIEVLQEE